MAGASGAVGCGDGERGRAGQRNGGRGAEDETAELQALAQALHEMRDVGLRVGEHFEQMERAFAHVRAAQADARRLDQEMDMAVRAAKAAPVSRFALYVLSRAQARDGGEEKHVADEALSALYDALERAALAEFGPAHDQCQQTHKPKQGLSVKRLALLFGGVGLDEVHARQCKRAWPWSD